MIAYIFLIYILFKITPNTVEIITLGKNPPINCIISCLFSYPMALYIPSSCFLFRIIEETSIYNTK